METLSVVKIADITGARVHGHCEELMVEQIVLDSRTVDIQPGYLFFALEGPNHDGHDYIDGLIKRGMRLFVVSKDDPIHQHKENACFLLVDDTLVALQTLARAYRAGFDYPVVGITGSNGKTIVKEWLFQSLSVEQEVVCSPKSYNSQTGVPLSVFGMHAQADIAILEAGISQPGEMQKLEAVVQPEIGIFTNLGEAHQENFTSYEQKLNEKLLLFKHCHTLVYHADNDLVEKGVSLFPFKNNPNLLSWSFEEGAKITASILHSGAKTEIELDREGRTMKIIVPYSDQASIENAIHVAITLQVLGVDERKIRQRLEGLMPVAMRLELKHGINQCLIINDAYNSDPASLKIALDFLDQQTRNASKTVILSDILQTGIDPGKLYQDIASQLTKYKVDKFIGIGPVISTYKGHFKGNCKFFLSTKEFIKMFKMADFQDASILVKGSRTFEFEKLVTLLEKKTHLTVLEVNLNAMVNNLNYFRSLLDGKTRVMAMVKASSYGSGSYEVANLLQHQRVDYLGVAFADEGLQLREAGINLPIMVMNPSDNSFEMMIDNFLEPEIYSFNSLDRFTHAVSRSQVKPYPVHLKFDTGMHRLGFVKQETSRLLDALQNSKYVEVKSIFSHLAASEDPGEDDFTRKQVECLVEIRDQFHQRGMYPWVHVLNSAGIERYSSYQFDMVRLGIGLYGIGTVHPGKLKNISRLKTTITQVKAINKGETVGYNRVGKAGSDMKIATIPIGYADGLNRKLSNGVGKFQVNGKFAPVIGNICMDMCMLDITGIDASEGDEVIIFDDKYTISDLAKTLSTIPYEVLTSISSRVKRVYYHE